MESFSAGFYGVNSIDMACEAAQNMEREGVNFIELCRGFGDVETQRVIDSVDGRMPVGSAGII